MEQPYDLAIAREWSAGLFLGTAGLLLLVHLLLRWRRRRDLWPSLLITAIVYLSWVAVALFEMPPEDGILIAAAGLALLAIFYLVVVLTDLAWLPCAGFGLVGAGALIVEADLALWLVGGAGLV